MPLLRKAVLLPVEGLDYSKPATFISDRASFPKNMRFDRSELAKKPGKTKYGSIAISDATQIMGLGKLETNTGLKYLYRVSKAKLEKYNTTTGAWDDVGGGSDFSGGDDDFFSFAVCSENKYIAVTNYINVIRKHTGSGNTTALGGSPPKCKFMEYLSPYLLLAYTNDGVNPNPWEVQWCDTGDPEDWTGGNSGSEVCADEPSPIRQIKKLNEFAAVYKRESLWLGRKVDTSAVFNFEMIRSGIGLGASRALVDVNGVHHFMGLNDFYKWNGADHDSIGDPAVRDEVFSKISRDKIGRCFAIHIKELTEVWFFIVTSGNSWPTEIWKYNYRNGFWYFDTCNQLTSAIVWEKTSSESWADQTTTWDTTLGAWDDAMRIGDWEEVVFGRNDGHTLQLDYSTVNDDGGAVEGWVISKDFTGDKLEFYKRWLQLDVWAKGLTGDTLKVSYSTDRGNTWKSISNITLTNAHAKYELYFDVVSERIRFKFMNNGSGETFYLRNFYPYYLGRAQVRS